MRLSLMSPVRVAEHTRIRYIASIISVLLCRAWRLFFASRPIIGIRTTNTITSYGFNACQTTLPHKGPSDFTALFIHLPNNIPTRIAAPYTRRYSRTTYHTAFPYPIPDHTPATYTSPYTPYHPPLIAPALCTKVSHPLHMFHSVFAVEIT